MNSKELKAARVQLFRDATNFKKTERIPHFANVVTWKVFDAGYTLDQAMTNFDVLEESVVKFLDTYLSEKKVNKDHAALMLMEILSERGLVNKETLHAAREKLNSITDSAKAE